MIETTDFNKSEQYTLSIRLSTDGFSFSVFNPLGDGEFSYYDREVDESFSLTANLKQTFRELAWLERPFRRVNVLMADKRFTFIPLEFFEDEQTEIIFYHNHPKRENETVQYNILHKNSTVVLFGIRVPAPSFANSIPMSSSIPKPAPSLSSSPQRAAWATTGRCMHTCEKMP